MMTKLIEEATLSRGLFLGVGAFAQSVGTLVIEGVGGHIYEIDKRYPYLVVISSEGLVILAIMLLAICRQLNI